MGRSGRYKFKTPTEFGFSVFICCDFDFAFAVDSATDGARIAS